MREVDAPGIRRVKLIDATPIGINVRSTVATYAGVHDELRKVFARTPDAKEQGYKAGGFLLQHGEAAVPHLRRHRLHQPGRAVFAGRGHHLPGVPGSRYGKEARRIKHRGKNGLGYSLPQLMAMDIHTALKACQELKLVRQRLQVLEDLGLGYLTLGEATPALSGGEAQRLKLASEMGRGQEDTVFVFDEPTIGLHPLDVRTLLQVFETLIQQGATVVVIEHDLDVIRNADYIIDMGPRRRRGGRPHCGPGHPGTDCGLRGKPDRAAICGKQKRKPSGNQRGWLPLFLW